MELDGLGSADDRRPSDLMNDADLALYQAKSGGRAGECSLRARVPADGERVRR